MFGVAPFVIQAVEFAVAHRAEIVGGVSAGMALLTDLKAVHATEAGQSFERHALALFKQHKVDPAEIAQIMAEQRTADDAAQRMDSGDF
jgi:hypothetical protein